MDQLWCKEQKKGRIQLTAVDRGRAVQQRAEVHAEDVHHLNGGFVGANGAQCLEVGLAGLRGNNDELADACPLLPGFDKFVHDPVKRSSPEGRTARKGAARGMHPVFNRGGSGNAECFRQVVRHTLHDDRIAPER